jgi:hypothetical protein
MYRTSCGNTFPVEHVEKPYIFCGFCGRDRILVPVPADCHVCEGAGSIEHEVPALPTEANGGMSTDTITRTCDACGGTGREHQPDESERELSAAEAIAAATQAFEAAAKRIIPEPRLVKKLIDELKDMAFGLDKAQDNAQNPAVASIYNEHSRLASTAADVLTRFEHARERLTQQ